MCESRACHEVMRGRVSGGDGSYVMCESRTRHEVVRGRVSGGDRTCPERAPATRSYCRPPTSPPGCCCHSRPILANGGAATRADEEGVVPNEEGVAPNETTGRADAGAEEQRKEEHARATNGGVRERRNALAGGQLALRTTRGRRRPMPVVPITYSSTSTLTAVTPNI